MQNYPKKKKVLVAMSGGVDSSVAALLLKEAGFEIAGVTMRLAIHHEEEHTSCCVGDAVDDARQVCDQLGISHYVFDFASLMQDLVIDKFISEYLKGRTPNPCVDCNRYLKFGVLLQKATGLGFDYLATGHYARIEQTEGRWRLLKPVDANKDQTYFLYPIKKEDLPRVLFPLGGMKKEEVRARAIAAGLHVAQKAESQDICFVSDGGYRKFFEDRGVPFESGEIVDRSGKLLGRHSGIIAYTIGQRSGLGISARTPLYVLGFDTTKNRIIVGNKEDLYAPGLTVGDLNLLTDEIPDEVDAKIRYRKKPARCRIEKDSDQLKAFFSDPQESITPGQAFVFYSGDEVLGGGVIEKVVNGG